MDSFMSFQSVFKPDLFRGQVVIITGAGSGIGRCTAHELASLGARVALVGRTEDTLKKVQAEIQATGAEASVHTCDIREEERVAQTVRDVLAKHGRIDALVNNAGGQYPSPLHRISLKGFEAVVRSNLTGGFLFSREVYTQTMRANGGAIVNIIMDMWHGLPGMGHSGAARAGMLNLTETAAVEWAPVRVNAIAPGYVASSGMDKYPPILGPIIRAIPESVPLQRYGTESEISAAVVFLLSPASAFTTGACLRIDGAAPGAKRVWPMVGMGGSTAAFDGFHLAEMPAVVKKKSFLMDNFAMRRLARYMQERFIRKP
jgi:citronellol/citronellal dehydrogenase